MDFFRRKKEETQKARSQQAIAQLSTKAIAVSAGSTPLVYKDSASVLIRPRITEKATAATVQGAYVFEVNPRATKKAVADDIRRLYKVSPKKITIVRIRPRKFISRMRNRRGKRAGMKKALVYLKEGDTIEIS
jgi:large subunit ribosomal protein L23